MFNLLLILGTGTLYLGFCAVLGVLVRQAQLATDRRWTALGILHSVLVVLPATAVVLSLDSLPTFVAAVLMVFGAAAIWAGAVRPTWLPSALWQVNFGTRYFASVMAVTAAWGLTLAFRNPSLGAALVGATALAAALSSLTKSTDIAKSGH